MRKLSAPIYSMEISDEEREQAATTRKAFEGLLDKMGESFDHLYKLSDSLEGVSDTSQFITMGRLFQQYKRKTRDLFNDFIKTLEAALLDLNKTVSDSQMEKIRDTIVAEVREIRDGVIDMLDILDAPEEQGFAADFRETVERVGKRSDSLREIIDDQLFIHIDEDILGKIRLGGMKPSLQKLGGEAWLLSNIPLRK